MFRLTQQGNQNAKDLNQRLGQFKKLMSHAFKLVAELCSQSLFLSKTSADSGGKSFSDQAGNDSTLVEEEESDTIELDSPHPCFEQFLKCHPLIICHFASKIMICCSRSFEVIQSLHMDTHEDLLVPLSEVLDGVQTRLIDAIASGTNAGNCVLTVFNL